MQVGIESMPKPIQEFIGNAQKRFTTWEGQARETITDTYNKMLDYPTVKKVEKTFDDWYSKHNPDVYFKPLKKRVEKFSTSWGNKAFSTVGLATQSDIKSITRKINKLRNEIKKIGGTKKSSRARS